MNALNLTGNHLKDAKSMIEIGFPSVKTSSILLSYHECPLLHLILEIIDALHLMNNHCCLCQSKLPFPSSKPATCGNLLCIY
jgi:hypothetical protein